MAKLRSTIEQNVFCTTNLWFLNPSQIYLDDLDKEM